MPSPSNKQSRPSKWPDKIDSYAIMGVLGRGVGGAVKKAVDEKGNEFAVKRLPLTMQTMGKVSKHFERLKMLSHANIVEYVDVILDPSLGSAFYVLELVKNGSLRDLLEKHGALPEGLALNYSFQLLYALAYLHDQSPPIVHRDVKAANCLLTESGLVKLCDFGVAITEEGRGNTTVGSPFWLAPEVVQQEGAVPESDIWSLGATLVEMLTTEPPNNSLGPMAALYKVVNDPAPPLPEGLAESLSANMLDFLKQCFVKSPTARPSAIELLSHAALAEEREKQRQLQSQSGSDNDSTGGALSSSGRFAKEQDENDAVAVTSGRRRVLSMVGINDATQMISQFRNDSGQQRKLIPNAEVASPRGEEEELASAIDAFVRFADEQQAQLLQGDEESSPQQQQLSVSLDMHGIALSSGFQKLIASSRAVRKQLEALQAAGDSASATAVSVSQSTSVSPEDADKELDRLREERKLIAANVSRLESSIGSTESLVRQIYGCKLTAEGVHSVVPANKCLRGQLQFSDASSKYKFRVRHALLVDNFLLLFKNEKCSSLDCALNLSSFQLETSSTPTPEHPNCFGLTGRGQYLTFSCASAAVESEWRFAVSQAQVKPWYANTNVISKK